MVLAVKQLAVLPSHPQATQAQGLLDRVSEAIRARHDSLRTEEAYVGWIRRFILFHKDIDFAMNPITVRDGKGQKYRVTMLPTAPKKMRHGHLKQGRQVHQPDLREGMGRRYLPDVLARNHRGANRERCWHCRQFMLQPYLINRSLQAAWRSNKL